MRPHIWALVLSWVMLCQSPAWGKRYQAPESARRLQRDSIKAVEIKYQGKQLWLHWKAPNGKWFRYRGERVPPGLHVRLHKLQQAGKSLVAVGGRYALQQRDQGTVRPTFAYAIKSMWRGVKVVKWDGVMPLYTATILPTSPGQKATSYTLFGSVSSRLNERDNKLVCLYGTWFVLDSPQRTHRISQSRGVKGTSLFFFDPTFRHPRNWRQLPNATERRKAYFAAKQRKARGLPPLVRKLRIPHLPIARQRKYLAICHKRLAPWEKKFSSASIQPTKPPTKAK